MKRQLLYCPLLFILALSACGGTESPENSNVKPTVPEAKVTLRMNAAEMQFSSNQGDALPVVFEGTWGASNLGDNRVYVQVFDESGEHVQTATSGALNNESFALTSAINHALQVGEYESVISVIACKDINCNSTYSGSKVTVDIKINVAPVPEWRTHQANASHDGYVPIWLNHYEFEKLWEWKRELSSAPLIRGINYPVAGNGNVYVSTDSYFADSAVIALDELTGEEQWRLSLGNMPLLNSPAINSQTVFVSTAGHEDSTVWAIERDGGELKFQVEFSSQWGNYLAPTVYNETVYHTGGYFGGHSYAFLAETGEGVWSQVRGTSLGMDTPAVDNEHLYVHDGKALSILKRSSGELVNSIVDPFGNNQPYYFGSPVIGSNNNVLAFSGGDYANYASGNAENPNSRIISNYDIKTSEWLWSSTYAYKTVFATTQGVVYAGRNNPATLDAIDETTGEVIWSWVPPSDDDTLFHRNIVVTKNLLFVSTNAHLYAIDLELREPVWSYDEPGMIAISDNRTLFLAPGASISDGRLIAFDLRSK